MIVVRDIFRLKFGQSKEATALWKEAAASLRTSGHGAVNVRLLTDFEINLNQCSQSFRLTPISR